MSHGCDNGHSYKRDCDNCHSRHSCEFDCDIWYKNECDNCDKYDCDSSDSIFMNLK